ncbi:MAG: diguanylate cyclase [Deltaproteobacteria bacterium]|nr:diguanylate cyclase [Deltaproteobacteria bacterium]
MAYAALIGASHRQVRAFAVRQATLQIEDMLVTHRAVHRYLEEVQKPELYRLQREGSLYPEYFSPEVLSSTFVARTVHGYAQEERSALGRPDVYFKLASDNARNPLNEADAFELALLRRMNDEHLEAFHEVVEVEGEAFLYVALPRGATGPTCMRCHGDPADAPAELVARYGAERGFYERQGRHRALLSLRAPLAPYLEGARGLLVAFALGSLAVLVGGFGMVWFFLRRLDAQEQLILERSEALREASRTDFLTGLSNRLAFVDEGTREIEAARRYQQPLSLLMLDVDHFKRVNDTWGHERGDQVLVAVAAVIREQARASDLVARWGGEEFAVLLRQAGREEALALARRIHRRLNRGPLIGDLHITVSVGGATLREAEALGALTCRADEAMFRAKAEGRNGCVFSDR